MRFLLSIFCACLLLASAPSMAQVAAEESAKTIAPLSKAQTQRVVDALIENVQKHYVFPNLRKPIAQAIRTDQQQGRLANLTPSDLAARLSATLFTASNDKHLNVSFDPARSKSLTDAPDPQDHAFFDAEALRTNHGYVRQEILPGNVRYVRIQMFHWTDKTTEKVLDSAAEFLSGGSAVIIDIRGNGGGHAQAVQRLISYLMPASSTPLMTFFNGTTGESEILKSIAKLPSNRITKRPVYVLIDRASFSAAEEFAYHIQQFKLGTLIGETTAGGANNNMFVPLPEGLLASISFGRPVHPVSKSNWEGVGVAPDKTVPGPAALDVALNEALSVLADSPDDRVKAEVEWELPALKARLNPVVIALDELQSLTGIYGEREIRMVAGKLTSYRAGLPPIELTPMGEGLFAAVGRADARFKFIRETPERITLELQFRDGTRQAAIRQSKPKA
jgi:Peptidase family S41/N-terminal domain of Peptidase_S41 in eukaryotic IRBP